MKYSSEPTMVAVTVLPAKQPEPKTVSVKVLREQPMPDIIDSLKRLERVGSENSKATEKLLNAAQELEQKIVEAFNLQKNDNLIEVVVIPRTLTRNPQGIDFADPVSPNQVRNYFIEDLELRYRPSWSTKDFSVSTNRQTALDFSEDIAKGLLNYINDSLEKHKAETEGGASVLADALSKLK